MTNIFLLINLASTLFLAGVIWIVQIVQYPFFSQICAENFSEFHRVYRNRITPMVAPPMILELGTAIALLFFPPANIDFKLLWASLILSILAWASTFFVQVPLHDKLAEQFHAETHAALVKTNWIRTILWSLRAALVLFFAWQSLK